MGDDRMGGVREMDSAGADSASQDGVDRFHAAFFWTASALMVAALWVRPVFSSLWVDEIGTWWVIQGSAREAVTRSEAVQGQSAFYYLILWFWKGLGGHSEVALRLPSVACACGAAIVLYFIAKRLVDIEAARIAVVAFVVWPQIVFAASDARPYALATLLTVSALLALIAWLDAGGVWRGVLAIALAALVPYGHPLSGLVLIPFGLYAGMRVVESSTTIRPRSLIAAGGAVVLLTIPVAMELLSLAGRSDEWTVPTAVSAAAIVAMMIPAAFVAAAFVAVLLMRGVRIGRSPRGMPASIPVLLVGWLLIPIAVLVGVSLSTPMRLLSFRYFIIIAPAGALLAALLIRSLEPARTRRFIVLSLVVVSALDLASPYKSGDMRGAIAMARSEADDRTVTLLRSGFQESLQTDWYRDPERAALLNATTSYYPLPGEVVPLPVELTPDTADFVRAQIDQHLASTDRFLAITATGSTYGPWLDELLQDRGYTSRSLGSVNTFTVTEFTRDGT